MMWEVENSEKRGEEISITLKLSSSEETRKIWAHDFEYRYEISLGEKLKTRSHIRNTTSEGSAPLSFQIALHTYFTVGEIQKTAVSDLSGLHFLDNLKQRSKGEEKNEVVLFTEEFDRIYVETPPRLTIADRARGGSYIVYKEGFVDSVVWNPWIDKSRAIEDLDDDGYLRFVCVESGAIVEPVTLIPGDSAEFIQELEYLRGSA